MKKSLLFGILFLAACSDQGGITLEERSLQQGQAKWASNESNEKVEKATKTEYQKLNLQQVVAELQIIPTASYSAVPAQGTVLGKTAPVATQIEKITSGQGSTSEQILSEIHSLRMKQESYQISHLKKYVDQLKVEDRKVSVTVQLAGKTIFLQNESEKLIRVFRALANLDGRVQVPLYDTSAKKVEKIIEIPMGGVLNNFTRQLVQKSKIEQCRQVLCALTELMYTDTSEDVVSLEKMNSRESAAYQLIFNAIYHRYLIPFYVPRLPMFQEAAYQINLKRFEVFNSDQVHLISEALWKLPPTFDQLPALLYFLADNQKFSYGEVRNEQGVQTLSATGQAHMVTFLYNRPDELYERFGYIVIENQEWGKYPDQRAGVRSRLKKRDLDTPLHEMIHAFDFSLLPNLSLQKEWLEKSFWKESSTVMTRQFTSFSKVFPNVLEGVVTVVNRWSHSEAAQFISSYAQTSPTEDFAVHAAGYMLFPKETMTVHPAKTNFLIRNVFSGEHKGAQFQFQYQ